ncbi:MAG: hypothetical protein B7Y45_06560 [Sphingomonas sp. 28-66-16]|nr:MAG: hypothetical protein B7Y45_06560 [Sphingomonas sp. 28-66-16]
MIVTQVLIVHRRAINRVITSAAYHQRMLGRILPRITAGTVMLSVAWTASPALAQSSFADRTTMSWDGAFTGIFLGLLLFSIAYNAAFYSVLRERFLVWQSLRAFIYFALTVGLSPLDMGAALGAHSFARQVYLCLLFDLSVAVTGPFVRAYIEPGMIAPRVYRLLGWTAPAILITTPAMLIPDCPPLYMTFRNAVLVGTLLLMCYTLAQAWRRGSRTARFQSAAWSCVLAVYGASLFHDIFLATPFTMFLFALFGALGFEVMLTAIGIGDRFLRLKREHDEARATASALHVIAHSDALTGLNNRRAIERAFADRRPFAIAIVDLDHFKAVNDRYGHDVGDRVIQAAAAALASGTAVAGRIGGEEFVLLLHGDAAEVADEAERLRTRVTLFAAEMVPQLHTPVTASVGLVLVGESSFAVALKIADISLYSAKGAGRDRLVLIRDLEAA